MKTGKISEPMLKRSVLRRISYKNPEMFCGAGLGRDFAVMKAEPGQEIIFSTDTVTCGMDAPALYGITKTANNIAASGGQIKAVLVSLTMPPNTTEAQVNSLMRDISAVCKERGIEIIGGHTETVPYVSRMVVTFTGAGTRSASLGIDIENIRPGMDIVMSKEIALEGTAILAYQREEELLRRFTKSFVDQAKTALESISVESEAAVAVRCGVQAMHDASQGGIFGALWELGAAADLGLEVQMDKLRIRQETIELCELVDVNPYSFLSGGCLLMVTEKGAYLEEELLRNGIQAQVIGHMTDSKDRVVIKGTDRRYLEPPRGDEIQKIFSEWRKK